MRKSFLFIVVVVLILGGLEYLLYQQIMKFTRPPQKNEEVDPKDLLLNANEIHFDSDDAVLHGWLILGKPGFPALIIAHDYGSNRSLTLTKLEGLITGLNKQGYFIFLFDFRGHGTASSRSTLGYKEANDLQSALKAILKFKQIGPRVGVLGVGMGALAAAHAFPAVNEVKLVILDSIYYSIPSKFSEDIIEEWPFITPAQPVLVKAMGWNMQKLFKVNGSETNLNDQMRHLYPKTVVFVEKKPVRKEVLALYEAAREPKELLQLEETASGELISDARIDYERQVQEKVEKYLPAVNNEKTLELPH